MSPSTQNIEIRESRDSEPLELSPEAVQAIGRMGRRLASQRSWWGEDETEAGQRESTAIKCLPVGDGRWRVRVDNAIGVFRVGDLQVVVEPKVPLPHVMHLFAEAGGFPKMDEERAAMARDQSLWTLVSSWFTSSAEALLRRGLIRDYRVTRDDLTLVRGHVHPATTATNFYRGRLAFDCEFEEFNIDTPLNRVVLAAARRVAGSMLLEPGLRKRAISVMARMDEGVGPLAPTDLLATLDRRTSHYGDAIPLARHVLRSWGRTIQTGEERAWSFLIPTPDLVETGIRNILARGLAPGVSVVKRGRQLEGSTLTFNPDLVFGRAAVGDVKYKLFDQTWRRSDLYEVLSFGVAFRTERVCLVNFSPSGAFEPLAPLRVGDMTVTHLVWRADQPPDQAAEGLVNQARRWLQDSDPNTLGQNALGANEAAMSG
jgi:hypothetical protein